MAALVGSHVGLTQGQLGAAGVVAEDVFFLGGVGGAAAVTELFGCGSVVLPRLNYT